jgi:hypothetical protein
MVRVLLLLLLHAGAAAAAVACPAADHAAAMPVETFTQTYIKNK